MPISNKTQPFKGISSIIASPRYTQNTLSYNKKLKNSSSIVQDSSCEKSATHLNRPDYKSSIEQSREGSTSTSAQRPKYTSKEAKKSCLKQAKKKITTRIASRNASTTSATSNFQQKAISQRHSKKHIPILNMKQINLLAKEGKSALMSQRAHFSIEQRQSSDSHKENKALNQRKVGSPKYQKKPKQSKFNITMGMNEQFNSKAVDNMLSQRSTNHKNQTQNISIKTIFNSSQQFKKSQKEPVKAFEDKFNSFQVELHNQSQIRQLLIQNKSKQMNFIEQKRGRTSQPNQIKGGITQEKEERKQFAQTDNIKGLKEIVNDDTEEHDSYRDTTRLMYSASSKGSHVRQPSKTTTNSTMQTPRVEINAAQIPNKQNSVFLESFSDKPQYPMTAAKCLATYGKELTDYEKGEILDFKQVYFTGKDAIKIKGSPLQQYNFGYDDERGDYQVILHDHFAFRFEVVDFLGKGSFGQAIKVFDHKRKEFCALKVIRNKKRFHHQAAVEVKLLKHLRDHDTLDQSNIIQIKEYMVFRKHLCITFELLSINLYDFIKNNNFQGVSLGLIRRFAIQILQALRYTGQHNIIHCDLKPENILLKCPNKSGIKIIDFGSSCFSDQRIYTYIQSRFYRAPEIILGIPYTAAIDMWSFICILAELYTGYPIFPGESEMDQLGLMMEIIGVPNEKVLEESTRKSIFFQANNEPIITPNSKGKKRHPNTKILSSVLHCKEKSFLDFIMKCLTWDPTERMTPEEALQHQWVIEGLPPRVLQHHQKVNVEKPIVNNFFN